MVTFKPYYEQETGDLIAHDVFINDGDTPMGWIEMRDGQVSLTTNDHERWFDVLTPDDLRAIASYMEHHAVFTITVKTEED